ncbi:DUF1631 family protein [Azonexus sp.]|uniref:DUF1631 family protein n=1 Tax=Azonexus sp. TaxID=1872668 RepID=UPI0035B4A074
MNTAPNASHIDRFQSSQAARKFFLDHLSELLRDSRLISESAIAAMIGGCGKYFDEMMNKRRLGSFEEEARGLTSSRISLVGDDDLELDIRLDHLCSRLIESTSVPLWKTHLRFATILGRPDLPKNDNPVGPRGVTQGLHDLFSAAGASSLEKKFELLDRIEVALLTSLPGIYGQLDDFLQSIGVEVTQPPIASTQPPSHTAAHKPEPQVAVSTAPAGSERPASATHPLLSQGALENLMFRLDQMERSQQNSLDFLTATSPNLESLIPELFGEAGSSTSEIVPLVLQSDALGIPANSLEGQAIDLTGRFFNSLFNDPTIPDILKETVAKLQVRVARIAVRDRNLFSHTDHPCRQFIDRLAKLLYGLPLTVSASHPVCQKMLETCDRLRQDTTGDAAAFAAAAAELEAQINARHQKIFDAAAPYHPFLRQLDRREQADREIAEYYARMHLDTLPELLRNFILQDWKRLLERAWFEQGQDGPAWRERTETLNALVWSFRPKADGEQRRSLAQKLPGVLQAVKEGMETLGIAAETQTRILDTCFELQTRAMRPNGSEAPPQVGASVALAEVHQGHGIRQLSIGWLEAGNRALHTMDYLLPPATEGRNPVYSAGEWMEIKVEDVDQQLCLCLQSANTGRCLFFNPENNLALAIHPQLLAEQLKKGSSRHLGQPGLFATLLARISGT